MIVALAAQSPSCALDACVRQLSLSSSIDPAIVVAGIALGLSLWANYGNLRSTILTFSKDVSYWRRTARRCWIQLRIRMMSSDSDSAAAYLKRQPSDLAYEALFRLSGGLPGVPLLRGPYNDIAFALVREDVHEIADLVYKYFTALRRRSRSEMDQELSLMASVMGFFLRRYQPLLQIPIALNMVLGKKIEGRVVSIFLNEVEEESATIRWQVTENLEWGAPIDSEGYVCLVKMQTGFWRIDSYHLVK